MSLFPLPQGRGSSVDARASDLARWVGLTHTVMELAEALQDILLNIKIVVAERPESLSRSWGRFSTAFFTP